MNRSAIDKVVFQGSGAIAQGPIPPNNWAFDKELKGWGPVANVELAKQKLAEGGQPNGFKVTFDTNNSTQRVQISQLIQEQLPCSPRSFAGTGGAGQPGRSTTPLSRS